MHDAQIREQVVAPLELGAARVGVGVVADRERGLGASGRAAEACSGRAEQSVGEMSAGMRLRASAGERARGAARGLSARERGARAHLERLNRW